MKTQLEVNLELITPDKARNYLSFNSKNRKLNDRHVNFLSKQINKDLFLENGESIIFDVNGNLKDGQHRLKAISLNNKSYYIPVVRNVNPISMATYDTGKNRTAGDVLTINGFKYGNTIASLVTFINKYYKKKSKSSYKSGLGRVDNLTHQEILKFTQENYYWMVEIIKKNAAILQATTPKVLSVTQLSYISYLLGGESPSSVVYNFNRYLVGLNKSQGIAPTYLFNKLYNSKINKEPLHFYWILGMSIKAFNFYIDGNPSVSYFKFSIEQDLPKINNGKNINKNK